MWNIYLRVGDTVQNVLQKVLFHSVTHFLNASEYQDEQTLVFVAGTAKNVSHTSKVDDGVDLLF